MPEGMPIPLKDLEDGFYTCPQCKDIIYGNGNDRSLKSQESGGYTPWL